MDYSNKYCKMCENLPELKKLQKSIPDSEQIRMKKVKENKYEMTDDPSGIFIPTDKQLHVLVDFKFDVDDPYFKFIKSSYHQFEIKSPFNMFSSFEQYALAYVMKAVYGKVWFNEKWVTEKAIESSFK